MGSVASKTSKSKVPLVQTKFRPISKMDAPAEIKKTDSQRLGLIDPEVPVAKKEDQSGG